VVARCFIALELGSEAFAATRMAQDLLDADAVRKASTPSLHVTLKFLGDVSVENVARPAFERVTARLGSAPRLGEGTLHGFPEASSANIVVLSCSDSLGEVGALAATADEAAFALGVEREDRAFHPHITLGRARRPVDLRKLIKRFEPRALGFGAALTLYESKNGAYTSLATVQTDSK
jgi:RNA 2',3'-cyclic 3'-phosphodiesterase